MYVPATPLPAAPLAPVGIVSAAASSHRTHACAHRAEGAWLPAERPRRPTRERHRYAAGGPPARTRRAARGAAGARQARLADADPRAHRRARSLPAELHAAPARQRVGAPALRRQRLRARLAPPARSAERVPPGRGLVVRRRGQPRVRRIAHELHDGRRQQDAAVRHAGHAALRRPHGARAAWSTAARTSKGANSTSPKRPRTRSASTASGRCGARAERAGDLHVLPAGWACSCRGWISPACFIESR